MEEVIIKLSPDIRISLALDRPPTTTEIDERVDFVLGKFKYDVIVPTPLLRFHQLSYIVVQPATAQLKAYVSDLEKYIVNIPLYSLPQDQCRIYFIKNNSDYLCLNCNSMVKNDFSIHAKKCAKKTDECIQASGCVPCQNKNKTDKCYLHLFDNNHQTNSFSGIDSQTLDVLNIRDLRHYDFKNSLWLPASILAFVDIMKHVTHSVGAMNYYFYNHTVLDMCNASPILTQAVTEIKLNPNSRKMVKLSCPTCDNHAYQETIFHYSIMFVLFDDTIEYYDTPCGHKAIVIKKELPQVFFPLHELINNKIKGNTYNQYCCYRTVFDDDRKDDYDENDRDTFFNKGSYGKSTTTTTSISTGENTLVNSIVDSLMEFDNMEQREIGDQLFTELLDLIPELRSESINESNIVLEKYVDVSTINEKQPQPTPLSETRNRTSNNTRTGGVNEKNRKQTAKSSNKENTPKQTTSISQKKKTEPMQRPQQKDSKHSSPSPNTEEAKQFLKALEKKTRPKEESKSNSTNKKKYYLESLGPRFQKCSSIYSEYSYGNNKSTYTVPRLKPEYVFDDDFIKKKTDEDYMDFFIRYCDSQHNKIASSAEIVSNFIHRDYSSFFDFMGEDAISLSKTPILLDIKYNYHI